MFDTKALVRGIVRGILVESFNGARHDSHGSRDRRCWRRGSGWKPPSSRGKRHDLPQSQLDRPDKAVIVSPGLRG
jgi:hypothetical protein